MSIRRRFARFIEFIKRLFGLEEKSNMQTWAEKEIEIACKRERTADGNNPEEKDWDYGCACYGSALKAYKCLMGDGHSGFSIGMTKNILNRLIDGRPLTPIYDIPDIWIDISEYRPDEGYSDYQCTRMSSLFKYVYNDGTIKYKDIDSIYCVNLDNQTSYHSSLVQRLMDEMFPISMPYMPGAPIIVYCSEPLTDPKNGDFDTVGVFYAVKPDGSKIEINRYFKEGEGDWIEIDEAEYKARQEMDAFRTGYENDNKKYMPDFISNKFHTPDKTNSAVSCEGESND